MNLFLIIQSRSIHMDSDRFCFADNSLVRVSAEEETALNKLDSIVA